MVTKLQWIATLAALALALGFFSGCSEDSLATSPAAGGTAGLSSGDLAAAIIQGEIERMTSDGMDAGSAKGIFTVEWRTAFNPQDQSSRLIGEARAVGFEAATAEPGMRRPGVDMGTVSLNYGSGETTLQKHTGPQGGVAYATSAGRAGEGAASAVPFVSGGAYSFAVSGGEKFGALSASVSAPPALLALSSPAKGASISASGGLTVTWQGGSAGGRILLVVAAAPGRPAGGPPQGGGMRGGPPQGGPMPPPGGQGGGGMMQPPPMGGQRPMPDSTNAIIVRIDGNPGSYTIGAAELQQLVARTGAKSLRCEISQMTLQEVAHEGGMVHVVVRNADGTRLKVQ